MLKQLVDAEELRVRVIFEIVIQDPLPVLQSAHFIRNISGETLRDHINNSYY